MRVVGYIAIGFLIYYCWDVGGPLTAINNIAGEIYFATMGK